jgi:hypothetical protein
MSYQLLFAICCQPEVGCIFAGCKRVADEIIDPGWTKGKGIRLPEKANRLLK